MRLRTPLPAITLLFCLPFTAAADAGRKVIADWLDAQQNVQTMEGDFIQERKLIGLKRPVVSEGRLWFEVPGKMRWQVGEPPETIAIYQNNVALLLRPGRGTVERRILDSDNNAQSDFERTFLQHGVPSTIKEFEEFFTINRVIKDTGFDRVELSVKDPRMAASVDKVYFLIDPDSQVLAGYGLSFRDGSAISTRFSAVRRNVKIDATLFNPDLSGLNMVESTGD